MNLIGTTLGGRYIIVEQIGEGGMAIVYKAKDQLLNRYVAVKILKQEFTQDEEFVKKFKRESIAAASLTHPNIVSIFDVGEQDNIYYIVMEYIKGQTLKEYIKSNGKIGYKRVLDITLQIAMALDNAHKNGVVHRDIKPHNIVVTEEGTIKVTDFGIARASTVATVTNTNKVLGSVHYLSPEQAKGGFSDHRTDIYSLGVVMYEMLTGRLPFDAESPISVAIKHIQEDITEPIAIDTSIPKTVNDIVKKALQKDMFKRYQSAKELVDDIIKVKENPNAVINNFDETQSTRIIDVKEVDKVLKNKKKKSIIKPLFITLSVLVVLFTAGYIILSKNFVVKDVEVPNIIGLNEEEAKLKLEPLRLKLEVEGKEYSDKPEGTIIKMYPEDGIKVKEGSTIRVKLSAGQKKVIVPDLKGLDLLEAEILLKNNGLKRGSIERKYSDEVEKNRIMDQDPKPNTEIIEGAEVNIVISDGKEEKFTKVPILLGRSIEEAKAQLQAANLVLGNITYGYDSKYIEDVIISQDVAAGVTVKEGTMINVVINKKELEQTQEGQNNTGNNQ
ncbi:protein kinase domain-containing protein [Caloramator proteoclasticus]|uniref:non-specific serine/threonine protein kinase n=1 Tax=Caloramator proteoclasticus DSM 10124 TaxID=1121262 RepID=A0A1M5ANW5_9CLOT|nr:protein kinase [Caloramator proteoclasticus]SHF31951.1 serine/threonine protein kinase [Caloramator proteoclasticus DSM 10124]